jgi:hypothetical protein
MIDLTQWACDRLTGPDADKPITANAVQIANGLHGKKRAYCRLPPCQWHGRTQDGYQGANGDREQHLTDHREALAAAVRASLDPGWL